MANDYDLIRAIKMMDRVYARKPRLPWIMDKYYRLWRQIKDHPHRGDARLREIYLGLVGKMTSFLIDDPGCSERIDVRDYADTDFMQIKDIPCEACGKQRTIGVGYDGEGTRFFCPEHLPEEMWSHERTGGKR